MFFSFLYIYFSYSIYLTFIFVFCSIIPSSFLSSFFFSFLMLALCSARLVSLSALLCSARLVSISALCSLLSLSPSLSLSLSLSLCGLNRHREREGGRKPEGKGCFCCFSTRKNFPTKLPPPPPPPQRGERERFLVTRGEETFICLRLCVVSLCRRRQ